MLEQPDARPIEGDKYRLAEDYTYRTPGGAWSITVPQGFIWDGASVPQWLWSLSGIRPDGLIRAGALVHDYLYRAPKSGHVKGSDKVFTRKEADLLFKRMIREAGGSWWTASRAYWAVRWFGWAAWEED